MDAGGRIVLVSGSTFCSVVELNLDFHFSMWSTLKLSFSSSSSVCSLVLSDGIASSGSERLDDKGCFIVCLATDGTLPRSIVLVMLDRVRQRFCCSFLMALVTSESYPMSITKQMLMIGHSSMITSVSFLCSLSC